MFKDAQDLTDDVHQSAAISSGKTVAQTEAKTEPRKPPRAPKRPQPDLTKVSANFVPRTVVALEIASQLTGDNQTDVINRAVQLYAYVSKMIEDGSLIFVENPTTGAKERLVIL